MRIDYTQLNPVVNNGDLQYNNNADGKRGYVYTPEQADTMLKGILDILNSGGYEIDRSSIDSPKNTKTKMWYEQNLKNIDIEKTMLSLSSEDLLNIDWNRNAGDETTRKVFSPQRQMYGARLIFVFIVPKEKIVGNINHDLYLKLYCDDNKVYIKSIHEGSREYIKPSLPD